MLFVLVVAALLATAALLADTSAPTRAEPTPPGRPLHAVSTASRPASTRADARHVPGGEDLPAGRRPPAHLSAALRAIATAGRGFLAAFLPYEVGEGGPDVADALRAVCTEEFSAQLLAAPPRPATGEIPRRARLVGLEVTPPAGSASRISGSLRREGSLESFAFLFERRDGRWLASGAGE